MVFRMKAAEIALKPILMWFDRRIVIAPPGEVDVYQQSGQDLDGNESPLSRFRGSVSLIVNVASKCGFTPQYRQLQELQDQHEASGFTIIGCPCNDFGGQEPGDAGSIRRTCSIRYRTDFPMLQKLQVKQGPGQSELYASLKTATGVLPRWNFGKYLVNRDGRPIAFFGSSITPRAARLQEIIRNTLQQ